VNRPHFTHSADLKHGFHEDKRGAAQESRLRVKFWLSNVQCAKF
jgi:hypothetical protein